MSDLGSPSGRRSLITDPNTLNKYTKRRKIASGGFGEVFEIFDHQTNKTYALKQISKKTIDEKSSHSFAFANESKFNRILSHEYICKCHSIFSDERNAYFILDYYPNKTLSELIKNRSDFSELEIKHYGYQILLAIEYLHSNNVIHRDLKPSNILLTARMKVGVCDFGLAIEDTLASSSTVASMNSVCGTQNFIAPEVFKKGSYGCEVDIWSFGIILYTLMFHKTPFEDETRQKTKRNIININFKFPPNNYSEDLISLVKDILVANPYARPSIEAIKSSPFFNFGIDIPEYLPLSTMSERMTSAEEEKLVEEARESGETMDECDKNSFAIRNKFTFKGKCSISRKSSHFDLSDEEESDSDEDSCEKKDKKSVSHPSKQGSSFSVNNTFSNDSSSNNDNNINNNINTDSKKEPPKSKFDVSSKNLKSLNQENSFSSTDSCNENISSYCFTFESGSNCIVQKYIDISDKYGLGYLLSNGTTGIYFNDGTKIVLYFEKNYFLYINKANDSIEKYPLKKCPSHLTDKLKLAELFHKSLMKSPRQTIVLEESRGSLGSCLGLVYVQKWEKTRYADFFLLNDNKIQVVFNDKTEIIFYLEDKCFEYINKERSKTREKLSAIDNLSIIQEKGNLELYNRILYARKFLISNRSL